MNTGTIFPLLKFRITKSLYNIAGKRSLYAFMKASAGCVGYRGSASKGQRAREPQCTISGDAHSARPIGALVITAGSKMLSKHKMLTMACMI